MSEHKVCECPECGVGKANFPAIAYCEGMPLRNEIEGRSGAGLAEATSACTAPIAERFGAGPVDVKTRAHIVMAEN